jgi:hypothetical protein
MQLPVLVTMNIPKVIFLLIFFQITGKTLLAQKIIDSIKVCGYPVREGVIYQYDTNPWRGLCGQEQGVSILTKNDSVFHIGEGKIIGIHFSGNDEGAYAVIIRSEKDEFISYSNLKSVILCKGDIVKKGTFLGLTGSGDEGNCRQINFMLFNKKNIKLSFKREVEYIRCNISCEQLERGTL